MSTKIIHKFTALCLAVLYLLTMLKPMLPVMHYTCNYGIYAHELCINKDKPKMHCNGTCQLAKMLRKQKSANNGQKPIIPAYEGLGWYIGFAGFTPGIAAFFDLDQKKDFHYFRFFSFPYGDIITPPPQLVS